MDIGFTVDRYQKLSIPSILRLLKWTGVGFSEVTVHVLDHPEKSLHSARGMQFGLHLPNVGNCGYDFSSTGHKAEIEAVLDKLARWGEQFGFRYAVFHPPEAEVSKTDFDFYLRNLRSVSVPLILENVRNYSVKRFRAFYEKMKDRLHERLTGVCLDIPHAYLAGEPWWRFYSNFGSDVKVIHLSDCTDSEDSHRPFGLGGTLSLNEILGRLKQAGFNNILNFEIQPSSIRDLDAYFGTYLSAKACFQPDGLAGIKRRAQAVGLFIRMRAVFL